MPDIRNDNQAYARAHKRVEALRGFYMHLLVYLSVCLGLFLLDMLTPSGRWFFWPAIGWGMFVLVHGVSLLMEGSLLGERWEQRKIRQFMEKDRDRSGGPPRPPQPLAP